jgi:hypothetical protein
MKLAELKSNDNKKTFLFNILEHISDNKMEELLDITKTLEKLQESINIY